MTKREFKKLKTKNIIINQIKLTFNSYDKNNKSYSSIIYNSSETMQFEFLEDTIQIKYLWYFRPKGIYTKIPYYINRIIKRKHIKTINYTLV